MAGAGAASFAGGIGTGLANVLIANRSRQDAKQQQQLQANLQVLGAVLPTVMERATDMSAVEAVINAFMGDGGSKGKSKKGGGLEMIAPFLGPLFQRNRAAQGGMPPGTISEAGAIGGGAPAASGPSALEQRQIDRRGELGLPISVGAGQTPAAAAAGQGAPSPATPTTTPTVAAAPGAQGAPGSETFFGVPGFLTREQVLARNVDEDLAQRTLRMRRAAEVVLPTLRAIDPTATLDDAMRLAGVDTAQYAPSFQREEGFTIINGERVPVFGSFDARRGQYTVLSPETGQPDPNLPFFPGAAGGVDLGDLAERAARTLGYNSAEEAYAAGAADQVNGVAAQIAQGESFGRALGTGQGQNETLLDRPLDVSTAAEQGVPIATTMRELEGFTPVTPDQRTRKTAALALAEPLANIRTLITSVYPSEADVGSGVVGVGRASRDLLRKRLGRDADFVKLDAAINLALGNVARVLAAETGRLTEQDAERARTALADLRGWTDTRESALAKISQAEAAMAAISQSIQTPGEQLEQRRQGGATGLQIDEAGNLFIPASQ